MAEITIDEVTSGTINGSGAFDEIMKAAQIRLEHEYDKDRIKGTEYSKVYLGSMESAMQQSIAFVLGRQQASAQADLTNGQFALIEIERINALKQGELIDQQILKMKAEVGVLEKELIIMDSKILLSEAQLPKIKAETAVLEQELINMEKQNEKLDQDILVSKQQVKLMTHQVYAAESQISDTYNNAELIEGNPVPVAGILKGQQDKISNEADLVFQKAATERAQTEGTVDTIDGVIGQQLTLYGKQIDGFDRDAEQKLSKVMSDAYSVQRGTEESLPPPATLSADAINAVLNVAIDGVGAGGPFNTP